MADPTIPRGALGTGIGKCLEVAAWRLREAQALLESAPNTAAILFSFGVEEFGKAALLHEALQSGDDPVCIKGFYDHEAKLVAAGRFIAPSELLLSSGGFDRDAFDPTGFEVGQPADFQARLSSLYVEWKDGWRQGSQVEERTLRRNVESVGRVILEKRNSWIS